MISIEYFNKNSSLKFQYEKIWFISIQNIHEDNNIKKYSKEKKLFGILGIINIIKDNLCNEL